MPRQSQFPKKIKPSSSAFLVGAGISIDFPTCFPAANELGDLLVEWLCKDAPNLRSALDDLRCPSSKRIPYLGPFGTLRFELLLEWINYFKPEIYDLLSVMDLCTEVNSWHLYLAFAMKEGAITFTTNFDTMIERACEITDTPCNVAVLSSSMPSEQILKRANLIKFHGSFIGQDGHEYSKKCPIGTLSQIGRFGLGFENSPNLQESVKELIYNRTLVVSGYSGWDSFDVVPLFESFRCIKQVVWHKWKKRNAINWKKLSKSEKFFNPGECNDPDDLVLNNFHAKGTPVIFGEGPTDDFFHHLFYKRIAGKVEFLSSKINDNWRKENGIPKPIQALRDLLELPENFIGKEIAEIAVDTMAQSYGVDFDDFEEEETKEGNKIRQKDLNWRKKQLANLDEGRYWEAANSFLNSLKTSGDDGTGYLYESPAFYALHSVFWRSMNEDKLLVAQRIARLVQKEGRKRHVLWALVYGMYLEGNVYHAYWSHASLKSRRLSCSPETYRQKAYTLLEKTAYYAIRIPRVNIYIDTLRLLHYIEPDHYRKLNIERTLFNWLPYLSSGEESCLAVLDGLRWQIERSLKEPPVEYAKTLRAWLAQSPKDRFLLCYVELADAYVFLCKKDTNGVMRKLAKLERLQTNLSAIENSNLNRGKNQIKCILSQMSPMSGAGTDTHCSC